MIRLVLYVVIAILVLSFFGISLQNLISSPVTQANFAYLWSLLLMAWHYIAQSFENYTQNAHLSLPGINLHH